MSPLANFVMNRVILLAVTGTESSIFLSYTYTVLSGSNIPTQLPLTEYLNCNGSFSALLVSDFTTGVSLQAARQPAVMSVTKNSLLGVITIRLKNKINIFPV